MVLSSTFDYITQPLDAMDITMLRNTAVCGITALLLVVFGLSKLLVLIFYLLVIGIVVTVTWLYSLEPQKRTMVIECIKEVFNSFMQKCMDEALNSKKTKGGEKKQNSNDESSNTNKKEFDAKADDYSKLFG